MDMIFTGWQPGYSVGNRTLDQQHQRLLALCQRAAICMTEDSQPGVEQFHAILNDLADYAKYHFRTEEALLRRCGYPRLEAHLQEHAAYEQSLTDFLVSAAVGKVAKDALSDYLMSWWINHILDADLQYRGYLDDM